jgi:predicted GNAT family N-acyltransferase
MRKPWHKPKGSEKDDKENIGFHLAAFENNKIVGVGRLHLNSSEEAQIRYMATIKKNLGVGSLIIQSLEQEARRLQAVYIIINARKKAVNFYLKNGFEIIDEGFVLYGTIEHFVMKKILRSI